MGGIPRPPPIKRILGGLESLTILRISEVRPDLARFDINRTYKTTKRSRRGVPLLSLGGIDFVKTAGDHAWETQALAELEILDFVGGKPWADFLSCWIVGPAGGGWESAGDNLPTQVHPGSGEHCVRRAKWHCHVKNFEGCIWYTI